LRSKNTSPLRAKIKCEEEEMDKKEITVEIERLESELSAIKGTECEVYSRIVGYFRPVKQWNNGKQEEYGEREAFVVEAAIPAGRAS
jgi:anaerobic ribonucleoside-triphosphate reductase